jgi:hypothetical protein
VVEPVQSVGEPVQLVGDVLLQMVHVLVVKLDEAWFDCRVRERVSHQVSLRAGDQYGGYYGQPADWTVQCL